MRDSIKPGGRKKNLQMAQVLRKSRSKNHMNNFKESLKKGKKNISMLSTYVGCIMIWKIWAAHTYYVRTVLKQRDEQMVLMKLK